MSSIGACSWSLRAEEPDELAARLFDVGVDCVQLGLDPLVQGAWTLEGIRTALADRRIEIRSGMMGMQGEDYSTLESIAVTGGVRPNATWAANLAAAHGNAAVAAELGLDLVSFHAGFLPEEPGDPERAVLVQRLREVIDAFAERGVRVAFETGQETAETLALVLAELDRDTVGVNFDPANMILYDQGDPIEALLVLAPWIRQVHIKDALRTLTPGTWGEEVRVGSGEVDWVTFFGLLRELAITVDLVIEREAGDDRVDDVVHARDLVQELMLGSNA